LAGKTSFGAPTSLAVEPTAVVGLQGLSDAGVAGAAGVADSLGAGVLAEADSEGAGDEACSSLTPVVEHAESKRPEINSAAMAA
jgi:hypothetical protein